MKYQLILQFPEEKYGDLDWIADMEDILDAFLIDAEIDGHDMGGGEVNIFIDSNDPTHTFLAVKTILEKINNGILEDTKAAYRNFNKSHFVCLWPFDLKEFKVI